MRTIFRSAVCAAALALLTACGGQSAPSAQSYGTNPPLPAPQSGLVPTVKVASVVGWAAGAAPTAPAGFTVTRYAEGLEHPRMLHVLPNGDVLVAESSTQRSSGGGIMGAIRNAVQDMAGAVNQSSNRITLLRDSDGDGDVDTQTVFLEGLNQPFGMAATADALYVGNTDAVMRYSYTPGATKIEGQGTRVLALPNHPGDNGHWTRDLLLSPDGRQLYVTVGSVTNIADQGMEIEAGRAAVHVIDLASGQSRIFASGLRNPNGLAWNPESGALWVAVNERDMLGDDLVPDYMTSVRDGGFYGWPWSYYGQHVDARVQPQNPEMVARALVPDFALGAHTASLGLHFYTGAQLPARYRNGAFVGQHGSWNRSQFAGYKVVFVPFSGGMPSGAAEDFLTGFLNAQEQAQGRPVGVAADRTGAILVADDVGNIVWRVAADGAAVAPPAAAAAP